MPNVQLLDKTASENFLTLVVLAGKKIKLNAPLFVTVFHLIVDVLKAIPKALRTSVVFVTILINEKIICVVHIICCFIVICLIENEMC